jgi:hypothetical protein
MLAISCGSMKRPVVPRNGPDEFGDRDHPRLDMQMRIEQTRNKIAAIGIDDFRTLRDRAAGIRAHKRNVTIFDGDVGVRDDLARLNTDPTSASDDEVRRLAAHGHIHQRSLKTDQRCHPHSILRVQHRCEEWPPLAHHTASADAECPPRLGLHESLGGLVVSLHQAALVQRYKVSAFDHEPAGDDGVVHAPRLAEHQG